MSLIFVGCNTTEMSPCIEPRSGQDTGKPCFVPHSVTSTT